MEMSRHQLQRVENLAIRIARQYEQDEEKIRTRITSQIVDSQKFFSHVVEEVTATVENELQNPHVEEAVDNLMNGTDFKDREFVRTILQAELSRKWSPRSRVTFKEAVMSAARFIRSNQKNILSDDGPAFLSADNSGSYTGTGQTAGGGTRIIRSGKPMS